MAEKKIDIQTNQSKKTKHQMNVELFTHVDLTRMTFPQFNVSVHGKKFCPSKIFSEKVMLNTVTQGRLPRYKQQEENQCLQFYVFRF